MVQPRRIADLPESYQERFLYIRSEDGFREALAENYFIDTVLANGIIRELTAQESVVYAERFVSPEAIIPTVRLPCEIAFDGQPADNHAIVQAYADWLAMTEVPKLFVNTTEGHALIGRNRELALADWYSTIVDPR